MASLEDSVRALEAKCDTTNIDQKIQDLKKDDKFQFIGKYALLLSKTRKSSYYQVAREKVGDKLYILVVNSNKEGSNKPYSSIVLECATDNICYAEFKCIESPKKPNSYTWGEFRYNSISMKELYGIFEKLSAQLYKAVVEDVENENKN